MRKINLAIALHFHQPIGNFDNIIERAYTMCYKPFLEFLSEYKQVKAMIHVSGCLFDYLEDNHPEMIKLIKDMVSRKQVELMGGGYYEPILTAIPEKDAIGQIKMMSKYIKNRFNVTPKGMWIAERVWQPDLVKTIYKAGIRYLILDDEHLLRSGVKPENMRGYFVTGRGKEKLAVFPSNKRLRYLIPFKLPQETIDYFKNVPSRKDGMLFTYGDDGEKFGEWPGTHKWVFEENWLRNFFNLLQGNKDWIELAHFSDYLKNNKPTGTLTIKQGSYEEMMEWSDGNWLNFLSKYPEADQMHKKMVYVSTKIKNVNKNTAQNKLKKLENAARQLYMGQCNCAYWHGVFGGLYLYHLRSAIYNHLIEADKIADNLLRGNKKDNTYIEQVDFDLDGKNEVIIENNEFSIYVEPAEGGIVKELDYRPFSFNLVNTLSRKREPYHQKILNSNQDLSGLKVATIHDDFRTVDPEFKNMLFYDRAGRYFLRSYFVKKGLTFEKFVASSYDELGDFSAGVYSSRVKDNMITLERGAEVSNVKVKLNKRIRIKSKHEIEFPFLVKVKEQVKLNALFGLEFNVTMPDLNSDRYQYCFDGKALGDLNSNGRGFPVESFGILDNLKELGIRFSFLKKPAKVWYFPVKTISQSERAYEQNYQCSCILFLWNLNFKASAEFKGNVNISFEARI